MVPSRTCMASGCTESGLGWLGICDACFFSYFSDVIGNPLFLFECVLPSLNSVLLDQIEKKIEMICFKGNKWWMGEHNHCRATLYKRSEMHKFLKIVSELGGLVWNCCRWLFSGLNMKCCYQSGLKSQGDPFQVRVAAFLSPANRYQSEPDPRLLSNFKWSIQGRLSYAVH